jgi:hypothetical protein
MKSLLSQACLGWLFAAWVTGIEAKYQNYKGSFARPSSFGCNIAQIKSL